MQPKAQALVSSGPRAVRSDAQDTIEVLLNEAERLFAEKGIANVALTEIVARSGQKNRSAVHYHFKSRAGVLNAVLNRRLAPINARRNALLDALGAGETDAYVILRASLLALALVTIEEPWGPHYVSIAAQVVGRLERVVDQGVDQAHFSGQRRSRQMLERALPEVSHETMAQRLRWFNSSTTLELARFVRDASPETRTREALMALVDELATYGAAGLGARRR